VSDNESPIDSRPESAKIIPLRPPASSPRQVAASLERLTREVGTTLTELVAIADARGIELPLAFQRAAASLDGRPPVAEAGEEVSVALAQFAATLDGLVTSHTLELDMLRRQFFRAVSVATGAAVLPRSHEPPTEVSDDPFGFAATTQANWLGTRLSRPVPDYGVDWNLILPGGRALDGSTATIQLHRAMRASDGRGMINIADPQRLDQFLKIPNRSLIIGVEEAAGAVRFLGLDTREAHRQVTNRPVPTRPTLAIPRAYELDDLTYGLLWVFANIDDALLADDLALAERHRELIVYEPLLNSAVSREAAADLTMVSQMWLGSNFCAEHILRNLGGFEDLPLFWTREQRGEEACTWLLFRHKYDYLKKASERFAGSATPLVRAFCLPEDAVRTSPASERILLFLSIALMESLGIHVEVCTEPEYSSVAGFVLGPGRQAIIANWVRADGIWHVDTTSRGSLLHELGEAGGHAHAHSIISAAVPARRLAALAHYLELDWRWLQRRCRELADCGCTGLVRPRSRLLSVDGLDAACRYVGELPTEVSLLAG
jgi:hypothetical protein